MARYFLKLIFTANLSYATYGLFQLLINNSTASVAQKDSQPQHAVL